MMFVSLLLRFLRTGVELGNDGCNDYTLNIWRMPSWCA
jgi:hypothetical protein